MSEHAMTLDEFLGHRASDSGSDTTFLRWTKRQPPRVDTWLHTRAPILALWQHNWPRIVERTSETGEKYFEIWGGNWNCWESEVVLRRQYFRDKETGERKTPPTICPHCLLIERLHGAVDAGELSWTDAVFAFSVGSDSDRVLHAGGLFNAFGKQDLTQDELDELKKARIFRKEAWKENAMAKCNYVLRVVDNDTPSNGVQVSIEGSGLGDKLKAAIKDRMTSAGPEAGNPMRSPYCIRWEHHPEELRFDQKHRAIPMERIALTPQIRKLIVDDPPPDISRLIKPGNPKLLRASMEQHWCGPEGIVDWNEIFGQCEAAFDAQEKTSGDSKDDADFPYGENAATSKASAKAAIQQPQQAKAGASQARPANRQEIAPSRPAALPPKVAAQEQSQQVGTDADEIVACDGCSKDMFATDPVCPHCGMRYEEEQAPEPPPPPPPPKRTRSAMATCNTGVTNAAPAASKKAPAKAAPAAQSKVRPAPAPEPAPESDENQEWGFTSESGDGIPF